MAFYHTIRIAQRTKSGVRTVTLAANYRVMEAMNATDNAEVR